MNRITLDAALPGDPLPTLFSRDRGGDATGAFGATWEAPSHVHVDPATGVRCVVYGYVVGHRSQEGATSPLAEMICRLYRERGAEAAFLHNGVYAICLFDPREPAWFVGVDKLGVYPVFYARRGRILVVSSAIAELIPEFGTALDVDGVEELLALAYNIGERTAFERISRQEGGTVLRLGEDGSLSTRRIWSVAELDARGDERGEPALRRNIECFREVIADHLRDVDRPICFLSSGYDSRRIFLELRAQGAAPDTFTTAIPAKQFPRPSTVEPRIVARVTEGNPGRTTILPFPRVSEMVELVARRESVLGHECSEHEWILPLIDSIPPGRWQNFDGLGGDTFCNAELAICAQDELNRYEDTEHVVDVVSRPTYARFFSRAWNARSRSTLRERVRMLVESVPPSPNRLLLIEMLGRARRATGLAGFGVHRGRTFLRFPYLDDRMLADALRIDPDYRFHGGLQRMALDAAYPEYASIPSSHSPARDLEPDWVEAIDAELDVPVAGARTGYRRPEAARMLHAARSPLRSGALGWRGRLVASAGRFLVRHGRGAIAARLLRRCWAFPQLAKIDRMAADAARRGND